MDRLLLLALTCSIAVGSGGWALAEAPLVRSRIQIRFGTDLIIEGIRPGHWPRVEVPREEYLNDASSPEERFPTLDISRKY